MKYKVSLNGKDYEIEVERGEAILVDVQDTPVAVPVAAPVSAAAPAAAPASNVASGEVVEAPMAGVVVNVPVSVGQEVQSGETLCIIEAMKMENEISAPRAGKVAQVLAQKGANVENGTPLIVLG